MGKETVKQKDIQKFILGVNYWPINKAMYWWKCLDLAEVEEDFRKISECGLKVVRIFLLWEDFQPTPSKVSSLAIRDLVSVADTAYKCGILILPTLFCGHMSGINWMPGWMLGARTNRTRFPVMSNGRLHNCRILNYYTDRDLIRAQRLQCREIAGALKQHPAVWAYDLGNESSNCVVPPDRQSARDWLEMMAGELKHSSGGCQITLGMHAEDLEENRNLWPQDAACYCDFLCMHGYPFYLEWVDDQLDVQVLPFLGEITRWLGGKPVLFEEFGVSSQIVAEKPYPGEQENLITAYYEQALELLRLSGMIGAFVWCYGDYHPDLWNKPPLKDNPHERHFGLFRYDGSPKPAVSVIRAFACRPDYLRRQVDTQTGSWLDNEDREQFYRNPLNELKRLYDKFKKSIEKGPL